MFQREGEQFKSQCEPLQYELGGWMISNLALLGGGNPQFGGGGGVENNWGMHVIP